MSSYKKLVQDEAKRFHQDSKGDFEGDKEEHGGASEKPNFAKWLDRTRLLFTRVDELTASWTRAEIEMVKSSSRNAVPYGDPKESAYFAFHKDLTHELKKLRKK